MDCLVTRLEGVVNDLSLKKLGEIRIKIKANGGENFSIRKSANSIEDLYVSTIDGSARIATSNGGTLKDTINISSYDNVSIYLSKGEYELRLVHRNSLESISSPNATFMYLEGEEWTDMKTLTNVDLSYGIGEFDVSYISDMPMLTNLGLAGQNLKGNLRGIATLTNVYALVLNNVGIADDIMTLAAMPIKGSVKIISSQGITGDGMSAMANKTSLVELDFESSANIEGNITSIKNLVNLRTLKINGTKVTGELSSLGKMLNLQTFQPSSELYGSVEDLITTYRANGKKTGTLTLMYALGMQKATFEGQSIQSWLVANGGRSSLKLTWTATSITGESV